MLKPDIWQNRITDITVQMLKNLNISALLLDVDNTLSTHHGTTLVEGLKEWLKEISESGIKLCIVSNSKNKRVKPFCEGLSLPFISLALKPLPFGLIKAAKKLNTPLKNTALIGDQIFTDLIGARLCGIKIILLEPIKPEKKLSFKIRRKGEKLLKDRYKKKGWF